MNYWFHESVSCLHDCAAMVLTSYGQDPIDVLGARWCFFHDPDAVPQEEFYYPAPSGDLGRDLAPFHELKARWRTARNTEELLADIRAVLDDGRPALVVEDNFHMPNRPAYQDVHAAHLVAVIGYDPSDGSFEIMEPTPPLYRGSIQLEQFKTAVGSQNAARPDSRDFFFAGSSIGLRWIDIERFIPAPPLQPRRLAAILRQNLVDMRAVNHSTGLVGTDGLERYLRGLVSDARSSPRLAAQKLAAIYTVGWAHMAQAALHAEFLKTYGQTFRSPPLREAARRVDSLCAQWTALRIFGAHGAHGEIDPMVAVAEIDSRIDRFVFGHRTALAAIEEAASHVGSLF